jgi:hypothetical protein
MKRLIPMVFLACAVQVGSATPAAAMPGAAGADEFAVTTLVPGVSSRAQGSPGPLVAGRLVADRDAPAVPAFGPMHGAMADPGADRARPDPGTLGYVEQIEFPT